MQRVRVPISSFQFGEISDSLGMRTDTPIYAASAERLENMVVMTEGSVKKRTGLKFVYDYGITYSASNPEQSHLFPFVFDENEEYIISIEHQKVRCFRVEDGTTSLVATLTTDTSSAALPFDQQYLQEYTTAQYGDVKFICHPLFAPRMLTRTSLTAFEISTFAFDKRADNSSTFQPYAQFQSHGTTLDPSKTSGTGATLTTSANYWDLTGGISGGNYPSSLHIGTIVRYDQNEILITSVQSATQATGDIIDELSIRLAVLNPFRTIDGSTTVEVTQINHGYSGSEAIVIAGASATGGINTGNLNGARTVSGIIDENTYTFTAGGAASSAVDGGGQVTITTHAAITQWDEQALSAKRGYPAAVEFHQNRLVFGGSIAQPDNVWMSKIGRFFNFDVGDAADDDAISLVAATGDVNEIRYLVSNRDLQIFTASSELYVPTYLNQAITPTNVQIRKQTPYGCEHIEPMPIDGATIFAQRNGKIVREFLFTDSEEAYTSTAVSTISSHLINSPKYLSVVHSGFGFPDSYAALTSGNGEITLFSSNRAEKKASWTRVTTNGDFGSTVAIEDRLFANVYNSAGKLQLCEFSGEIGLDFYVYGAITANKVDVSSVYSSGDTVDVVVTDGTGQSHLGSFTVDSGDDVDLTLYSGLGFTHAYVGKKFTAKIITNPIDANMGSGPATGEVRGIANVVLDLKQTRSLKINGHNLVTETEFTGKKEFRVLGYSRDPKVTIEQNDPLAMQVNGLIVELVV
ncbi:MAG: hypothetical protein CMJ25_11615 [Phycisphaerae bacterium]|nr:hypothetical protein [Phycisphaerae bacterium]